MEPGHTRLGQRVVRSFADSLTSNGQRARMRELRVHDTGYGYDAFGMHRAWVALATALLRPLHQRYFGVKSYGVEHIPRQGPALFVANHGGVFPIDAAMLCMDVFEHTQPPRLLRPAADHFVPELPWMGTFLSRVGVVSGTRGNLDHLLEEGELVLTFPEGLRGVGKPKDQRYRLQEWSVGHAELALRHHVPIVPVAVIGAEDQWHELARVELRAFGAPYIPIPWPPLPRPVRYHIHYGEPLLPGADAGADDPARVDQLARATRDSVASLLERGLQARRGVFR